MTFTLDPAFETTTAPVTTLGLCVVRLQLDVRWPWLILVPRMEQMVEIEDLPPDDQGWLMNEAVLAGQAVRDVGAVLGRPVQKLNVGALGNITRQLHVHVVGRRSDDPAWPGPVWGVGTAIAPSPVQLAAMMRAARKALGAG
jgi:diadenosine tetraphosphate (Ap4A) HIT family hydrolase